ncbi:MAG: endo alpha-1,4 polygalactosaminidase [Candidatus Limnocylindrales bacterium]
MRRLAFLAVPGLLFALGSAPLADAGGWTPPANASWQVQFSGKLDLSINADLFDVDAFEISRRTVRRLHNSGRHAVCYVNAGAWEDWRPDAVRYTSGVKGKALDGWPGERWLDIRQLGVIQPILADRIEMCAAKGFDGIEFDNVDGYSNDTGFPLTRNDQLAFDRWLAEAAHEHGLSVGLKNTLSLADELEPHFDFAILEQCFQYRECALAAPFMEAGKSVLDIEYSLARGAFCAKADDLGITALRKRLDLGAWRRPC